MKALQHATLLLRRRPRHEPRWLSAAPSASPITAVPAVSRLQALRDRLSLDPPFSSQTLLKKSHTPATATAPITSTSTSTSTSLNAAASTTKKKPSSPISIEDILAQLPPPTTATNTPILTDTFHRHHNYLRLSISERCNLRCQYCMPPEGVPLSPSTLTTDEFIHIANTFSSHGVNKIRLTGGEPLLRRDVVDLVQHLPNELHTIGMTTNGITLTRHVEALVQAGLTHVNISLDTLKPERFLEITRRNGIEQVLNAIQVAANIPQLKVKINCVVIKGVNDDELMDFVHKFTPLGVDVRFIEWMPFFDNGWTKGRFVSYQTMLDTMQKDNVLQPLAAIDPNDTTKWWTTSTTATNNATTGRVGFITSMSEHFCGSCNRLRVTADGQLKVCLFGSTEVSLRDAIRRGLDITPLIQYAVLKKPAMLGGHDTPQGIADANDNRPMILIGG